MALARKCDRCGNFYEFGDFGVSKDGTFVTGVSFKRHMNDTYVCYTDLCRDCIDDLKKFLGGAELVTELDTDKKNLYLD